MISQKKLIHKTDWDILIILDACRYDYFEKIIGKYLRGRLRKVISGASETREWFEIVFGEDAYDDIIYVSANPYINSKKNLILGINLKKKFYRIIDVWDWGWDEKLRIIHPLEVNKAAFRAMRKYSNKKFIIHYMQPHPPFVYPINIGPESNFQRKMRDLRGTMRCIDDNIEELVFKIGSSLGIRAARKVQHLYRRMRSTILSLPRSPYYVEICLKLGRKTLQKAYMQNLKFVLRYVRKIVKKFRKRKIVITSDHGEMLGENGYYGHYNGVRFPYLIEVPWFEVEGII